MLKRAILYVPQLTGCFAKYADDPINIFYQESYIDFNPKIEDNCWKIHQFVSVDSSENVIGYLNAAVSQKGHFINNLAIIRFLKNSRYNVTFSKDLAEFFEFLFLFYKYRKIDFGVSLNSPNQTWYKKYVNKYGGRIVGILKQHFARIDGTITDYEMYEILLGDFCEKYQKFHPKRYQHCVEKYSLKDIKNQV